MAGNRTKVPDAAVGAGRLAARHDNNYSKRACSRTEQARFVFIRRTTVEGSRWSTVVTNAAAIGSDRHPLPAKQSPLSRTGTGGFVDKSDMDNVKAVRHPQPDHWGLLTHRGPCAPHPDWLPTTAFPSRARCRPVRRSSMQDLPFLLLWRLFLQVTWFVPIG